MEMLFFILFVSIIVINILCDIYIYRKHLTNNYQSFYFMFVIFSLFHFLLVFYSDPKGVGGLGYAFLLLTLPALFFYSVVRFFQNILLLALRA